jgi:phage portal protein BeeE
MGLRSWLAAADEVPGTPVARRPRLRSPVGVVRSGTALEVSELAWIGEGVSRETALSIPAVLACRNLIVGTAVQLGLYRYRAGERLEPDYLLTKPDPSTTIAATMGGTIDDLLFYGRAYWRVLDRDSEGTARRARWTPVRDVTPESKSSGGSYSVLTGYRIAGEKETVEAGDVIRFDSPLPGVLDVGGRTLAGAIETYEAQRRFASVELPAGTLKNEGTEVSPEEADEIIADFQEKRHAKSVAFLQGVSYTREQLSPADLQLAEMTADIATEVARLFNVPVAMIGASPSGGASALLYANLSAQLQLQLATAVAPHLRTVELTLTDVYPRGQSVAFDVQSYVRSDPQAAADYVIALLGAEIISVDEARGFLGVPTLPAPSLAPATIGGT